MEFIAGIIIGAAFSPFWMMVWKWISPKIKGFLETKSK